MESTSPSSDALPRLAADGRAALLRRLVALGLLQAMLAAVAALGTRWVFDNLQAQGTSSLAPAAMAAIVAGAGLALALVHLLLSHWSAQWSESLGQRYAAAVRSTLLAHLFHIAPQRHQALRHGHLMARLTGDLAAIRRWVGSTLAPLLVGSATLVLMLLVLVAAAPALTGVLLLALGAGASVAWRVSIRLEHSLRQERRQRWALAGQVGERLAEAAVVQAHAQSAREIQRLGRRQRRLHDTAVERARWSALLQALPAALGSLLVGCAAAWGAWQVQRGSWTPGALAGLLTLLGLALAPARDLALALANWRAWRVSREKLAGFLRLPVLGIDATPEPLAAPHGELHISREPPAGGSAPWSIAVRARETLALHGASGSGKSQLLETLAGLREDSSLQIRIDGQCLALADPGRIAEKVALVSADLPLLRGSIAGNLRYRRRRATPEALWQALAQVGLADTVAALPKGLATPVREGGRNLPGAVRARLALARALVGSPALLLIDDFDLLLQGDEAQDRALAELLKAPPCTTVIVTRSQHWRSRCKLSLDLSACAPAPAPRLALVHAT